MDGKMEFDIDPELFGKTFDKSDLDVVSAPYEPVDIKLKTRKHPKIISIRCSRYIRLFREKQLKDAASYNNVDQVEKILDCEEADPNSADEQGRTALHIAASRGYSTVVRALLQGGANPNVEDKLGNTPLHLAIYTGSFETVFYLLSGGSHQRRTARLPYSPLELAISKFNLLSVQRDCSVARNQVQRIISLLRNEQMKSDIALHKDINAALTSFSSLELDQADSNNS